MLIVLAVIVLCELAWAAGRLVHQGGRRHGDALARGLEAVPVGAVFHDAHFTRVVHITVLAHHLACAQLRLYLEASVAAFVAVSVRAILVVPVDLLEDGDWRRARGGGRAVAAGRCGRWGPGIGPLRGGRLGRLWAVVVVVRVHIVPATTAAILLRHAD